MCRPLVYSLLLISAMLNSANSGTVASISGASSKITIYKQGVDRNDPADERTISSAFAASASAT